jgi:hypothetical protein
MPITPFHLGPALVQKAVAPESMDLRLFLVASVAIDAEPIFKGLTEMAGLAAWNSLHTWSHTPLGMAVICSLVAIAWRALGLCSSWAAVWTAAGAGVTHWFLDTMMHGGGDMPAALGNFYGYGGDLAQGIAILSGLIGGTVLLLEPNNPVSRWLARELQPRK